MCGSIPKFLRNPVELCMTQNLSESQKKRVLQLVQRCLCELVLEASEPFTRVPFSHRSSPGSTQEKPN